MNKAVISGIAAFLGLLLSTISLYNFMEGRIAASVKREVEQVEQRKDIDQVEDDVLTVQGRVWTLEQQYHTLDKQIAVDKAQK